VKRELARSRLEQIPEHAAPEIALPDFDEELSGSRQLAAFAAAVPETINDLRGVEL
jgi:hypothetical protein